MPTGRDAARALDRADDLARFRARFVVDDPTLVYLDGNSLGRLPQSAVARLRLVVEREWGGRLIRGWNEGWLTLAQRVGAKIARCLGAAPDEVIVADSTSVNLFKLAVAALRARADRRTVVTDDLAFPTDRYVLDGALALAGPARRLAVVRSPDGVGVPAAALAAAIDGDTALVALCHAVYTSGFVYDLGEVTALARAAGALVLWDLSHSVGAMPLDLEAAGVDLAVGCSYKYLNGGPGAPAFLYVRRELQPRLANPIQGWFGHADQFAFPPTYEPGPGLQRFLCGTPPILALAAIEPGVDLVLEAGLDALRAKSVRQTEYLVGLWEAELAPLGFRLHSPREAARRGSHVAFGHPEAFRITRALVEEAGVLVDFREPDHIRFGIAPLYTRYEDLWTTVQRLQHVVAARRYAAYPSARPAVP